MVCGTVLRYIIQREKENNRKLKFLVSQEIRKIEILATAPPIFISEREETSGNHLFL